MPLKYEQLSPEIEEKLKHFSKSRYDAIRRDDSRDKPSVIRPAFIRDVEKIIHSLYYNRYADKTQVFSFYKNDDISRRAFHVQLVSRIARDIGRILDLDLDLIEAIALGHDIGHTPFGHAGERFLNKVYFEHTGKYFNHNVHSVRVLDKILRLNLTLQTLNGILCHNGELELKEYRPKPLSDFDEFDKKVEECYIDPKAIKRLVPSTLEGCVVRICDIIAYIGKDRQDAVKMKIIESEAVFDDSVIGRYNAGIINNLVTNIVEHSYGKNYLRLDDEHFKALKDGKRENNEIIYQNKALNEKYEKLIAPMFERIYEKLIHELKSGKSDSVIFKHHIECINDATKFRSKGSYIEENTPDDIVTDFIASMTDDYIVDLYTYLFNDKPQLRYVSYFNDLR